MPPENDPTQDIKSAGETAKGAVQAAKTTKTIIQVGSAAAKGASGPVGWVMLAAQLAPFLNKFKNLARKIQAGLAALIAYLLAMLALKALAAIAAAAIGAAIGFVIAGPIGAVVLGTIGAYIGWNYPLQTLHFITHPWEIITKPLGYVGNSFAGFGGSIGNAIGGALHTAGSFVTSAAAAAWGGVTGVAGGTLGALSAGANFVVGGLSSISFPASAAMIPVVGGTLTVGVGGILISTITATSFFSLEGERGTVIPGQNEFFSISKTATPARIANQPEGQTQQILFTVVLTAKETRLINVSVFDEMKYQGESGSGTITTDASGNTFSRLDCPVSMEPNTSCTQQITIGVDSTYDDSIITNTVRVVATPEGQNPITDSITAVVTVGNPPAQCPRGWPSTGAVTQGPEGSTSHSSARFGEYEAIDIGEQIGRPVYATFEGVIADVDDRRSTDKRIKIRPIGCPGLEIVNFWHLSHVSVSEEQIVSFGQQIGLVGAYVLDGVPQPHTHYQFNEQGDRSFRIEPPYIPVSVPRGCDGRSDCNITITSAP